MIDTVLDEFGIKKDVITISPIYQGLINNTWKVGANNQNYIVQKVNANVFRQPEDIAYNIEAIGNYLQRNHPDYLFASPVKTANGKVIIKLDGDAYFRIFPFVKNSHSIDVVSTASQAYEAAKQFAKFTTKLSGFDAQQLRTTIPSFHNLSLRFQQFENALKNGNKARIQEAAETIECLKEYAYIADEYEKIKYHPEFKLRVTHHDTKISNVLFDNEGKGLCVIDLDTVMPGYFISDLGDMMRTYLSPVSEEEKDFSKIEIREKIYEAIIEGYLSEMGDELTPTEKDYLPYAGKFMIYMQALRFITDYLNNDAYYGSSYAGHNFVRGKNQLALLQKLCEFENVNTI
jgi:Ser/Thr protein kinase RdoA (MazF antagonist)